MRNVNAREESQAHSNDGLYVQVNPRLIRRRVIHGFVTYFLTRAQGLLTLPLLARLLGPDGMGIVALAGATANLTWPVVILGLNTGMAVQIVHLKTDAEISRAYGTILRTTLVTGTIGAALVAGLIWWMGDTFGLASLRPYVVVVGLYTLAVAQKEITIVLPQVKQETGFISLLNLSIAYGAPLLTLVFVLWGLGPAGVLWADTLVLLSAAIWVLRRSLKTYNSLDGFDAGFLRSALAVSLPILPVGLGQWVLQSLDSFFIAFTYGKAAVGTYSVAYTLASVALAVNATLNWVLFPTSVSLFNQGEVYFRRFLARSLRIISLLLGYMVVGSVVLAPWGVTLVAGPNFQRAIPVIPWVVAGYAAWTLTQVLQGVPLTVERKSGTITWAYMLTIFVNVILNVILIPRFALVGAAIATAVSYGVGFIFMAWTATKILPKLIPWGGLIQTAVPTVIVALLASLSPAGAGAPFWEVIMKVLWMTLAFILLASFTGGLRPEDRSFFQGKQV